MARRKAEPVPTTVEEVRALIAEKSALAMANFRAQFGTDDVKAVALQIVKNADKVKWTTGRR